MLAAAETVLLGLLEIVAILAGLALVAFLCVLTIRPDGRAPPPVE